MKGTCRRGSWRKYRVLMGWNGTEPAVEHVFRWIGQDFAARPRLAHEGGCGARCGLDFEPVVPGPGPGPSRAFPKSPFSAKLLTNSPIWRSRLSRNDGLLSPRGQATGKADIRFHRRHRRYRPITDVRRALISPALLLYVDLQSIDHRTPYAGNRVVRLLGCSQGILCGTLRSPPVLRPRGPI